MRVLVCSNVFPPTVIGGAELVAYYHSKALRKRGCEIAIFCGDPSGPGPRHSMHETVFEGMRAFRVSVTPEDFRPEFVNFSHPRIEEHFEAVLAGFRPDVVHMHNLIGLSTALIGRAKRKAIKTLLTVHDHWGFCYKNTLLKTDVDVCKDRTRCSECMPYIEDGENRGIPVRLRTNFLATEFLKLDTLISPSIYLGDAYVNSGIPAGITRTIGCGIDVDRFSRVSKTPRTGATRFTFIGHLGRHKGVHLLIDAARILRDRGIVIHLIGVGELLQDLKARVEQENLSSVVRFGGKVEHSHIEQVFQETDVLVLPSIWPENQPVTILESMATRTPVVAARIGGIPEMVVHGLTGYLFEPGNAVDLAEKMARFVAFPERIAQFGEAGFQRIREASYEKAVDEILASYREPCRQPARVTTENPRLIACAGKRFHKSAVEAIEWLDRSRHYDPWQFVMNEWLIEDDIPRLKVFWVVDPGSPVETVHLALKYRVPLLIPDDHHELRELCRLENCGLYYRDAAEALECLECLLNNSDVSSSLGHNGFVYWTQRVERRLGATGRSAAQHSGS